jgi:hypothetical protein
MLSTLPWAETKEIGMPENLKAVLAAMPQQPQRQDSTNAQLADLRAFAVRLGLYDADNYLRTVLEQLREKWSLIAIPADADKRWKARKRVFN